MIRFVESAGSPYRILKMNEAGCWMIAFDDPGAPFFVWALGMDGYQRIETPEGFLQHWGKEVLTAAEQKRLDLIRPLLNDELCIADKAHHYLAVDTATELLAGLYVGMDAGETAMLKCLANAASDKASFCQEYGIYITHN